MTVPIECMAWAANIIPLGYDSSQFGYVAKDNYELVFYVPDIEAENPWCLTRAGVALVIERFVRKIERSTVRLEFPGMAWRVRIAGSYTTPWFGSLREAVEAALVAVWEAQK